MMTPAQNRAYWRLWGAAVKVNGWRCQAGSWECDLWYQRKISVWHEQVIEAGERRGNVRLAGTLAPPGGGTIAPGLKVDDLRRGVHIVATGRDKGHAVLSQGEIDKVFALLRLLANPEDLGASILLDGDHGERKRLVWRVRRAAPQAYVDAICRDKFGADYTAPYWEDLPVECLRALVITLSNRTGRWTRLAGTLAPPDE